MNAMMTEITLFEGEAKYCHPTDDDVQASVNYIARRLAKLELLDLDCYETWDSDETLYRSTKVTVRVWCCTPLRT